MPRRAEPVEHRDLGALAGDDERVRERRAARRPRDQCSTTIGSLDHDAGGHVDERAAGEERVVQHGERVGRRVGARAEQRRARRRRRTSRGRRPCTPLASSAGRARGARPGRRARRSARRARRPRRRTGRRRARARRPAAPSSLGRRPAGTGRGRARRSGCSARSPRPAVGHASVGEPLGRGERAASTSQSGPPSAARRVGGEVRRVMVIADARRYPTAPSMLSSMSRDSSTAYSIGSVLVIGSMKPFTIIAVACCSVSPRLIR